MDKEITEIIKLVESFVTHTNEINKRLITAIMVGVVAFAITMITIVAVYFLADYRYPELQQETTSTGTSQSIN